jgi:cell division septum initiation protein DivIVA
MRSETDILRDDIRQLEARVHDLKEALAGLCGTRSVPTTAPRVILAETTKVLDTDQMYAEIAVRAVHECRVQAKRELLQFIEGRIRCDEQQHGTVTTIRVGLVVGDRS